MITQYKKLFRHQPLGYVTAGVTSLIGEYGLFIGLYYGGRLPAWEANAIAFCFGLIINFSLNRTAVFKTAGSGKAMLSRQMVLYGILALVNLIFTSWLISVLVIWIPAAIAKLMTMALVAAWNYALYKYVIFNAN
jgi:putative flippase GtrA